MSQNQTLPALVPNEDMQLLVSGAAPAALARNTDAITKATARQQFLLNEIATKGMSPELDAELNNFMVKLKITKEEMNGRRSLITQTLTKISKAFTTLESDLEALGPDIQRARNDYAAHLAKLKADADAEILRKQNASAELVNLKADCERKIRSEFEFYLSSQLNKLSMLLLNMTLQSASEYDDLIRKFDEHYYRETFLEVEPQLRVVYNDPAVIASIISEVRNRVFKPYQQEFNTAIMNEKQVVISRIPGKIKTLQEAAELREKERLAAIEKAKAEQDRLNAKNAEEASAAAERARKAQEEADIAAALKLQQEEDENERKVAEQNRIDREAAERATNAEQKIVMTESVEMANASFDAVVNAEVTVPTGQIREGYEIELLVANGWLDLFLFWFNNVGTKTKMEKFENIKLSAIKAFAEKEAVKGNFITSKLLKYHETFKAVNKAGA